MTQSKRAIKSKGGTYAQSIGKGNIDYKKDQPHKHVNLISLGLIPRRSAARKLAKKTSDM